MSKKVSVIIPCFNEEEGIPQLERKILELLNQDNYSFHFIFVDDGSTDKTLSLIEGLDKKISYEVCKHGVNRNLGNALQTGIAAAKDCDFIGFLDSDCTYEPSILFDLLREVESGVDLSVTSPYHPEGKVEGVAEWRLFLSKSLSFFYRIFFRSKIYTFTSMVRVGNFNVVKECVGKREDYIFTTEMLYRVVQSGAKVSEVPTVLKARQFGVSKMKVFKTILNHINFICSVILGKVR